jgi:glycosyltransferase involved in cell wall biosynthesis
LSLLLDEESQVGNDAVCHLKTKMVARMKVSIVTVARNAGATIGDTLRSVAAQTGADIEHIIIDGASTDDTREIVMRHAAPSSIFVSEPDKGLYDAMNKGVAAATGELIGFLNADDFLCRTDAIALIVAQAKRHTYASAICGGVAIVKAENTSLLTRAYSAVSFRPWMLRFGHMPPHPGFYARASAFAAVGKFDPTIRIGADFEWMVRFFVRNRLSMSAIPHSLVTLREGGVSNDGFGSRRSINSEALASLRQHGVVTAAPVIWSKYLVKAGQFFAKPYEWPADPSVRWDVTAP